MYLQIFGYIGMFFAVIYRLPQIIKLCKTKKGGDISKTSFILQNVAYISLVIYLFSKDEKDYILISYEFVGLFQNCLIIGLKSLYKKHATPERIARESVLEDD